jgi:hypothetical protein
MSLIQSRYFILVLALVSLSSSALAQQSNKQCADDGERIMKDCSKEPMLSLSYLNCLCDSAKLVPHCSVRNAPMRFDLKPCFMSLVSHF